LATNSELLYEQVAHLVERQIDSGALRVHDRIPSVRAMSRSACVSTATVVQAYLDLERRGLIEARPKSGYYVRPRRHERLPLPRARRVQPTRPQGVASTVLDAVREAIERTDIVQLNLTMSHASKSPNKRLNALIREELRVHPNHAGEVLLPPGDLELRRQIARRCTLAGAPADPQDVVITGGTMDAITLALRTICRPGDAVLVESPTYFGLLQVIEHLGLAVVEVPNHPGRGIDPAAVRAAVTTQKIAAAVLMPNFNNPAGTLTSVEAKRELTEVLGEAGVPIVEDDIYGDLAFASERPVSLRRFDEHGLVISCGSVSKTIALGYRVGWVISPTWAADLQRAKFYSSVAAPTLQQRVLARYYASGGYDRFLTRLRRDLAQTAERFLDAIAAHFPEGTRVTPPAGGMALWIELPAPVDAMALFRDALASRIGIMPGLVFSAKADYRHYIRLSFGVGWTHDVERALRRLGALARAAVAG
jgi:DNA-binding transcriptional MocR family regulator